MAEPFGWHYAGMMLSMHMYAQQVHKMPRKLVSASVLPAEVEFALGELGRNLRLARLRRRMTQAEVAARLGVDRRTVAGMESGAPQSAASNMRPEGHQPMAAMSARVTFSVNREEE